MYIFILIVHIIVSLVLIAVILLQAGRGGGLAETFGGGASSQTTIFGQKMSSFLTKATTASAVLFLCTSLALAFLSSKRQRSLMDGAKIRIPQTASSIPEQIDSSREADLANKDIGPVDIAPETAKESPTDK